MAEEVVATMFIFSLILFVGVLIGIVHTASKQGVFETKEGTVCLSLTDAIHHSLRLKSPKIMLSTGDQ